MTDLGDGGDDTGGDPAPTPHDGRDDPGSGAPRTPRPLIERIGLGLIALVLAVMFGGISAASWVGGEPFLAVMGAIGCLMTLWVGALTVVRG